MALSITLADPSSDTASKKKIDLPAEVFDAPANIALMHQVVVAQLAAARQGTASTKTRGEVRGGGKKPYRQKGTGRARQGSTRAPQFNGGGVVHGPQPRSYEQRTPKKMKAAALRCALSDRARNDRLHVVTSLVEGDVPSTRSAAALLAKITESRNILVIAERNDGTTWKSLRNLDGIHLLEPGQLNTYDVLISDDIVFTQSALEVFLAGSPKGKSATAIASSAELVEAIEDVDADEADDDTPDYGPDSHLPLKNGNAPKGYPIKGNADSNLYHVPDSAFYERTVAEVWFKTAEAAEAAGFQLPPSQREAAEGDASAEEGDS
jgi:large subunit ribosomal protein L4